MSNECILIVEADILVRGPLAEYLRDCGYRVVEAGTPGQAKQLLEDGSIAVDIVMIEVGGEGRAGFELASWVRANRTGCKVVLAGTLAKAVEKAGDLCEEQESVLKPYDHRTVLDQIRRLLAIRGSEGGA